MISADSHLLNSMFLQNQGKFNSVEVGNAAHFLRDEQDVLQDETSSNEPQPSQPQPLNSESKLLEEMLAAGKITFMQKTIIVHDQAATGRTIAEILIIRGWL